MPLLLESPSKIKRLDLERRAFLDLMRMSNTMARPEEIARQLVVLARHLSACEAVAIRLKSGPGFPYVASLGFPEQFLPAQNDLCIKDGEGHLLRDERRQPRMSGLSGLVLLGLADRSKPWFTDRGSFVSLSSSDLTASLKGADVLGQAPDRRRESPASPRRRRFPNRRHISGYETVGLFPVRRDQVTYGLIQCNDRRPARFSAETVDLMEHLAASAAHLFQLTMT